jgi:hypothetical protein
LSLQPGGKAYSEQEEQECNWFHAAKIGFSIKLLFVREIVRRAELKTDSSAFPRFHPRDFFIRWPLLLFGSLVRLFFAAETLGLFSRLIWQTS